MNGCECAARLAARCFRAKAVLINKTVLRALQRYSKNLPPEQRSPEEDRYLEVNLESRGW
jgi:hypothetical protein